MMNDRLFRDAMGKFATGITVVTGSFGEKIHGMTVNAFMSVSLQPKLIAISIDEKASMYNKLQKLERFGVSILNENQKELSMIYAGQQEKVSESAYDYLDGAPVIKNALANLSCQVCNEVKAGDHIIYIAKVRDLKVMEGDPILYFGSKYRSLKNPDTDNK